MLAFFSPPVILSGLLFMLILRTKTLRVFARLIIIANNRELSRKKMKKFGNGGLWGRGCGGPEGRAAVSGFRFAGHFDEPKNRSHLHGKNSPGHRRPSLWQNQLIAWPKM
jgi:hypothetical protein